MVEYDTDFSRLLQQRELCCSCGELHRAGQTEIRLGKGVLGELPEMLVRLKASRPMLYAGPQTDKAAGEAVRGILRGKGIPLCSFVFPGEKLQPSERAVETAVRRFDPGCDLILAVGSGSVNDVCKAAATQLGVRQLTVATAPSMDGYTSASASLELEKTKASVEVNAPAGVLCELPLLSQAPLRLLWAGLGDMAAKTSSLTEWRMASLVNSERYCETVAKLARVSCERALSGAEGLARREEASVAAVTEGLLLSGLCMSYAGSSRPASGQEHYFSHCWEMMAIARGQDYDLHGIYVGVGTVLALRILKRMAELRPSRARALDAAERFDREEWAARLARVFPGTEQKLYLLEEQTRKNDRAGRLARADRLLRDWDELKRLAREAPSPEALEERMALTGMPTRPQQIGLSAQEVADAFVCSRDIRNKYLTSSMLFDLGFLEDFELWLKDEINEQERRFP